MSDTIISVENLGKKCRIRHQAERQRYVALRDVIAQKMKAPFHFLRRAKMADGLGSAGDSPAAFGASPKDNSGERRVAASGPEGEATSLEGECALPATRRDADWKQPGRSRSPNRRLLGAQKREL
ncbi:MAG: hypothetical protein HY298_04065 [Verrucomicrobia bacterium]|nr:hypothetical protein [Verrucomicrobiota bacterium]